MVRETTVKIAINPTNTDKRPLIPNAATREAMRELEAGGGKGFKTVEGAYHAYSRVRSGREMQSGAVGGKDLGWRTILFPYGESALLQIFSAKPFTYGFNVTESSVFDAAGFARANGVICVPIGKADLGATTFSANEFGLKAPIPRLLLRRIDLNHKILLNFFLLQRLAGVLLRLSSLIMSAATTWDWPSVLRNSAMQSANLAAALPFENM